MSSRELATGRGGSARVPWWGLLGAFWGLWKLFGGVLGQRGYPDGGFMGRSGSCLGLFGGLFIGLSIGLST